MADQHARTSALDQLNEFEREPVTEDHLHPPRRFAALFAGEHVAATEFIIGAFFILHGISAKDLFLGLICGNILAVASWTFICAPIAVQTRLTLYWYLRKIAGPGITNLYNVVNGGLYCILAGAMIAVASTAVGLAFNIEMPTLKATTPTSVGWVITTLAVGGVVTLLAILGFKKLSQFAIVCSPWMFMIFIAGAIAMLPRFGEINSLSDFWRIAETKIWNGVPHEGKEKLGFWHVLFFSWFCNLAMHVDLSDMAVFRYARSWKYGLFSALGMFPGHFLAWICSGIMMAAVNNTEIEPGMMAFTAAGLSGALAVVLAGWTTSNPTMYRAGLALQAVTPNWPRWKVTLAAGIVTSIVACFPVFVMNLLDFVAVYGLLLMPIGAVVFAEHWLVPRLGLIQYRAEKEGWFMSWPVLITWVVTLFLGWLLVYEIEAIHLFFMWLPGWFIAMGLYLGLSYVWRGPAAAEVTS